MASNERATMAEIAEQSGVSLSTVSLVLRDKAGVGAETRQRVLDVARELGYVPRRPAAAHAPAISTVGLVLKADPDSLPAANKFYSHVVAGIEMACRRHQVNLLYATMTVNNTCWIDERTFVAESPVSVSGTPEGIMTTCPNQGGACLLYTSPSPRHS